LPLLKSIYQAYHRRGLEIYQVSLDTDLERWLNIIRFEEIPWISVREKDPENPAYARLMNITTLPSNLLYDPLRAGNIYLRAGRQTDEFSSSGINPLLNTVSSLFFRENWMKLYNSTDRPRFSLMRVLLSPGILLSIIKGEV